MSVAVYIHPDETPPLLRWVYTLVTFCIIFTTIFMIYLTSAFDYTFVLWEMIPDGSRSEEEVEYKTKILSVEMNTITPQFNFITLEFCPFEQSDRELMVLQNDILKEEGRVLILHRHLHGNTESNKLTTNNDWKVIDTYLAKTVMSETTLVEFMDIEDGFTFNGKVIYQDPNSGSTYVTSTDNQKVYPLSHPRIGDQTISYAFIEQRNLKQVTTQNPHSVVDNEFILKNPVVTIRTIFLDTLTWEDTEITLPESARGGEVEFKYKYNCLFFSPVGEPHLMQGIDLTNGRINFVEPESMRAIPFMDLEIPGGQQVFTVENNGEEAILSSFEMESEFNALHSNIFTYSFDDDTLEPVFNIDDIDLDADSGSPSIIFSEPSIVSLDDLPRIIRNP